MTMLRGERVALRPVREDDLALLYDAHLDISSRGDYFPRGVISEPAFRRSFSEGEFWKPDEGLLVIEELSSGQVVGHIEFFKPVSYWDAYELSYQLYDGSGAGRGYVTEAVQLTVDYLFDTKQRYRIHLVIHPDNQASRRIAEKCGFQLEGTLRGPFFNHGTNHDVVLYSLIRPDPRPWRSADAN